TRSAASPPSYVALDIPGLIVGRSAINNAVAISPDGRRILIVANAPDDVPRIFVRELSSTSTLPIAGTELGYAPTWSPDGKQIAFFANGKLKTVAIAGGAAQTLCDAFSEGGIAWNDSGTLLFGQINAPDGPGMFKIDSHGGAPVRLTRPDRQRGEFVHLWPEFLPDGKRFFFTTFSSSIDATSSNVDLMVGSIDGGAPKRIGPLASRVRYRDGLLYFVRDSALLSQPFDIEALRFTGDPTIIADGVEYVRDSATGSFSVASNGSIAYRTARTDSRLIVLDRTGQQLMDLGRALFNWGRIAPDGSRVVMSVVDPKLGLADLWMYDLSGRAPSRITFDTFDEGSPVWTHDAHALYYRIDIQGPPDIFRFDLDTNRREPVLMAPGRQEPLDVSPDGSTLLFQDFVRSRGFDLRVLPTAAGGKPQPFVATPFDESDGRFSPNGRWISFTSNVSGRAEVYVAHFPSRGTPIRASRAGGSLARWRADGRELTFLAPSGDLMAVSVIEKGDAIDFGAPQFLFRTSEGISSYEVTTDGRFVVATDEINPPPPIRLVLH
ncbi:MAG: TolB family protein, partial [Thermoanaerobaculia bacterium]